MGSILHRSATALHELSNMNENNTLPQLVASRARFKCVKIERSENTSFQEVCGLGEHVKMTAPLNI